MDDETYQWADWGDPAYIGWFFQGDFITKGIHLFDAGTAFWTQVDAMVTDMTLQCSGAVSPKDVQFDIPEGICVGGNPFPANVDLSTVFPISATKEGAELDGSVSMLKINGNGASVDDEMYQWANWGEAAYTGWFFQGDFIAAGSEEHALVPGQSFWISVSQNMGFNDLKLYFPAPYTLGE